MEQMIEAKQYDQAIELGEKTAKSLREKPEKELEYIGVIDNLAYAYEEKGEYLTAIPLMEEVCDRIKKRFGAESVQYFSTLETLAQNYKEAGNYASSEASYLEVIRIAGNQKNIKADDYINVLLGVSDLYLLERKFDKAELIIQDAIAFYKKKYGSNAVNLSLLNNLAEVYRYTKRYEEAEKIYLDILPKVKAKEGESGFYGIILNNLALTYKLKKDYEKAIPLYQKSLDLKGIYYSTESPEYITGRHNLAVAYLETKEFDKAEQLLLLNYKAQKKYQDFRHPLFHQTLNILVELYIETKQFDKASLYFKELIQIHKLIHGVDEDYCYFQGQLAEYLSSAGKYSEAEQAFKAGIGCMENIAENNQEKYAELVNLFGEFYRKQARYQEAETYLKKAIRISLTALGDQHENYAKSLNNLAIVYTETGQYSMVEPLFQEAIEIIKKSEGTASVSYLKTVLNLTGFYINIGRYDKAEPLIREVLDKIKQSNVFLPDVQANCLNNLAFLLKEKGEYEKAIEYQKESVKIWKEYSYEYEEDYALALNNLAMSLGNQNDGKESLALLEEALGILREKHDSGNKNYALLLKSKGVIYASHGLNAEAEACFIQSMELVKGRLNEFLPAYIEIVEGLANFYFENGRYKDAEDLTRQSLALQMKITGDQDINYITSINNLALLFLHLGRFTEAEPLFLEAIEKLQKSPSTPQLLLSDVMSNLGQLYQKIGLYDKSERLFIDVLAIREKQLGPQDNKIAQSANNLGTLYILTNRAEMACKEFQKASNILKLYPGMKIDYAITIDNLARSYAATNQPEKSVILYDEANKIFETYGGKSHPDYILNLFNLASFYYHNKRYDEAQQFYEKCFSSLKVLIRYSFSNSNPQEQRDYLADNVDIFEQYFSFLKESRLADPGLAYSNQLFTKGILLYAQKQMWQQLMEQDNKALKDLLKQRLALIKKLSNWYSMSDSELKKQGFYLKGEKEKLDELDRAISKISGYNLPLQDLSWENIQEKLLPDEAAIEITRFRDETNDSLIFYAVLIVTKGIKIPKVLFLENGNDLESTMYNRYLKGRFEEVGDLYEHYWMPIQSELNGIRRVYLSADGIYNQINLDILLVKKESVYLSDLIEIVPISSTRVLLDPENVDNVAVSHGSAVLIGGLQYSTAKEEGSDTWSFLPGTLQEIEQIKNILDNRGIQAELIEGEDATEEKITNLSGINIMHIATHGFFKPTYYDSIQNIQARKYIGKLNKINDWTLDPLLRSGIVLSNANSFNRQIDSTDGLLTAFEIGNTMDLRGTSIVVLSACDTGKGGNQYGEGIYGLWRGFQMAGAQSVIMSLWPVHDQVAEEFFQHFYTNWLENGLEKRKAFYEARKQIRNDWNDPGHWGAFIFVSQ
ncbi:MAG: tetratricopeptide repeat protein [Saprospiraceae bacterium]|nr:tetratricopeptide repeat protein [Saprospiraceae bacterium]